MSLLFRCEYKKPFTPVPGGGGASGFVVEVGEDLLNHHQIFNAGDDLDTAAAADHRRTGAGSCWRVGIKSLILRVPVSLECLKRVQVLLT